MRRLIAAVVFAAFWPNASLAAALPACAAALSPDARMIYDLVLPDYHPGDVLRDVVRSHTRSLVIAGRLARANARPAAEAAGMCIKQGT